MTTNTDPPLNDFCFLFDRAPKELNTLSDSDSDSDQEKVVSLSVCPFVLSRSLANQVRNELKKSGEPGQIARDPEQLESSPLESHSACFPFKVHHLRSPYPYSHSHTSIITRVRVTEPYLICIHHLCCNGQPPLMSLSGLPP